jgi:hypothetical protein
VTVSLPDLILRFVDLLEDVPAMFLVLLPLTLYFLDLQHLLATVEIELARRRLLSGLPVLVDSSDKRTPPLTDCRLWHTGHAIEYVNQEIKDVVFRLVRGGKVVESLDPEVNGLKEGKHGLPGVHDGVQE